MMKRICAWAGLALLAFPLLTALASADGRWETREIKWRLTRFESGSSAANAILDTAFAHVGGTASQVADTTGWFSLTNLCLPSALTDNDSLIVAVVTIVQDTSVAVTPNVTEFPYLVQLGNPVGVGIDHIAIQTAATTGSATSGDDVFQVPIYAINVYQTDEAGAPGVRRWGSLPAGKLGLRVIFPATTYVGATGLGSARAYVSYPVCP